MPRPKARLKAESVSFVIGDGQQHRGHAITANLGYDPDTGQLVEIAFCEAGKIGHGVQILLSELGIKLSRALQQRNPETGEEDENEPANTQT